MRVTQDVQRRLLSSLADLGFGQAESEDDALFAKRFLPVREHVRAFEPEVALVVGERGAGKSALFQAVFRNRLISALARQSESPRLTRLAEGAVDWVPAYPKEREFPDPASLRAFFGGETAPPPLGEELWKAYLVRALVGFLGGAVESLRPLIDRPAADAAGVHEALRSLGSAPVVALDELDERLEREGRTVFVGYDELDTLGGADPRTMARAIEGLVAFWASHARRWSRIRPKIFLRTDLFRRHAGLGGSDLPKLAANRAELTWNDRNLYAMLLKRIANTNEELCQYVKDGKVCLSEPDPDLGFVPRLESAEDARPFTERLVGVYMGASSRKGQSFQWLLDHVRDGKGRASPRALVRLVEQAAQRERDKPRAEPPRLLHPTSLRLALEDVSSDHVRQAANNEWPWLWGVESRLKGEGVPRERRVFEKRLSDRWEESWGQPGTDARPPAEDARAFLEYLVELGVLRERPRGRVDTPNLFLFGLGLRRKGGVKRK